jgi:hypothetical protein
MEVTGAGGIMDWRTGEALGTGVPTKCSGRGDLFEEEFEFRFCDGIAVDGNAVAVLVLEVVHAGRDSTPDDPTTLRNAGADSRASSIAVLAFSGTST